MQSIPDRVTQVDSEVKSGPKVMIAIPCMDSIPTPFFESMTSLLKPTTAVVATTRCSLVYDARNMLCKLAVDHNFDRVFWLDSDMVFQPDILQRLMSDMDEGRRYVAGLYFTRKNPIEPVIYQETGINEDENGKLIPYRIPYKGDVNAGEIVKIAGSGMGGTLMEVSVIREVFERFGLPFSPELGFGEDLSFCRRCEHLGIDMYCDTGVQMGHVAQTVVDIGWYNAKREL